MINIVQEPRTSHEKQQVVPADSEDTSNILHEELFRAGGAFCVGKEA